MVSLLSIRFRNGFDDSDTYRRENVQRQNLLTNVSFLEMWLFCVCTHMHVLILSLLPLFQIVSAFFSLLWKEEIITRILF